jgi:repressor of nif and glnA expression
MVRWLALSLGLISPNETRTLMLDVFEVLLDFHFKNKEPNIHDILEKLEKKKNEEPNPKAVRYHLLQLKNKGIIDSKKRKYSFTTGSMPENSELPYSIENAYTKNMESSFKQIEKVIKALKRTY